MAQDLHQVIYSQKPAIKAHLLLIAVSVLPLFVYVPPSLNVVVTAGLAVYAGCWRSVKPEPAAEQMTKSDAMRFPIMGSCVLFGLFIAFKFLPKDLVNMLLTAYMGFLAILVLTGALLPFVEDKFPKALQTKHVTLPRIKIPHVIDLAQEPVTISIPALTLGTLSTAFCTWYVIKKHWFANNVLGCALSLEGIEYLNLGSVQVGCILLVGLFFYDIFWVFCTPVMVSVAKNFDAPIKLLFPRAMDPVTGKIPFSMLGLGDIVIPGIFVALMLRMDVQRNFETSYFRTAFFGYTLGLGTTIAVMNIFNAAQPALLYIVPAVLGTVALHAWSKGELMKVFNYHEPKPEEHKAEEKEAAEGSAVVKKDQ